MPPISVVLADDNAIFRAGCRDAIGLDADLHVVGEAADLPGLLDLVEALRPAVVVTDIRMPPGRSDEGIRAAQMLRASHPGVGVVVLSNFAEAAYAIALLEDGSQGRAYVLKEKVSEPEGLRAVVRVVADGGSQIDTDVVNALIAQRSRSGSTIMDRLTSKELEVLSLVAQGTSNAAIASRIFVGERAVEKHINSIFAKLDLPADAAHNRRVKAALLFLSHQEPG